MGPCDHSSRLTVADELKRRYPKARRGSRRSLVSERKPSYSVLLQLGFTKPRGHPRAGELLPHRFTVTYPFRQVVFFSVALSADLSAPSLTANSPYEVPTFLSGFTPSDHALNFSPLGTLLSGQTQDSAASGAFYHILPRNLNYHLRP